MVSAHEKQRSTQGPQSLAPSDQVGLLRGVLSQSRTHTFLHAWHSFSEPTATAAKGSEARVDLSGQWRTTVRLDSTVVGILLARQHPLDANNPMKGICADRKRGVLRRRWEIQSSSSNMSDTACVSETLGLMRFHRMNTCILATIPLMKMDKPLPGQLSVAQGPLSVAAV
jgi:hypothetical protein